MRLDPITRDYRVFLDDFDGALSNENTRLYLDTSLLMWLIRLGREARSEFIAWCSTRPPNSVRVPVWTAHELHRHLVSGTVRTNLTATLGEAQSKYDEFIRLAAERADDLTCRAKGYAGKSGYVAELERSSAVLGNLIRVAQPDESVLRQAVDEVVEFVNARLLATDINPLIRDLSVTGGTRFAHRMPPGFLDRKDENAFGDVIIWEEMLQDLMTAGADPTGQARDAVFISRDKKTDWVSSAPYVQDRSGDPKRPNRDLGFDVTLPHPLLVHEFTTRAGANRLYVTHPAFLGLALERASRVAGKPSNVRQWLAAAHRPDLLGQLAGLETPAPGSATPTIAPTPVPVEAAEATTAQGAGAVGPASPATSHAENDTCSFVMALAVTADVQQYATAMPQEQSELLATWTRSAQGAERTGYELGRILAELAIARVPGWPAQLPALIESLTTKLNRERLNQVALASITSVYFDRYGELLRQPLLDLGAACLTLEPDARLQPAFERLGHFLEEADAKLPYLPGKGRPRVRFALELSQAAGTSRRIIHHIRIGQHPALAYPIREKSSRTLSALLRRTPEEGCTGQELRGLLAHEYLIPADLLSTDHDAKKLTWLPAAGLVNLDSGADGGVSALAEEDNDHE